MELAIKDVLRNIEILEGNTNMFKDRVDKGVDVEYNQSMYTQNKAMLTSYYKLRNFIEEWKPPA